MDLIVEALRRAQAQPSAALGFDPMESKPHVADQLPPTAALILRGVGTWLKDGLDARVLERGPRGEGRIDFVGRRSVYRIGAEWRLMVEGRTFVGRPGAWTELVLGDVNYSPEWTLATLARTTDSTVVGSRIADAEYVELSGVATVDPALWVDNGGRYLRLDWLEAMVMVRAWMDPEGRLRLARLRWEYGPGQREAEFERIRRQYGVAEELPTSQRTLVLAAMTRSRSRSGTSEPPGQLVRSIPTTPGGIESRWPNSSQSGSRFAAP